MAATKKNKSKKKHVRKSAKKYRMLTFESSIFEGEFTLPDMKQAPMHVLAALDKGQFDVFESWVVKAGADRADAEVVQEMDAEELKTFIGEWSRGTLPK